MGTYHCSGKYLNQAIFFKNLEIIVKNCVQPCSYQNSTVEIQAHENDKIQLEFCVVYIGDVLPIFPIYLDGKKLHNSNQTWRPFKEGRQKHWIILEIETNKSRIKAVYEVHICPTQKIIFEVTTLTQQGVTYPDNNKLFVQTITVSITASLIALCITGIITEVVRRRRGKILELARRTDNYSMVPVNSNDSHNYLMLHLQHFSLEPMAHTFSLEPTAQTLEQRNEEPITLSSHDSNYIEIIQEPVHLRYTDSDYITPIDYFLSTN
ncbi:uncharacterized protein LOC131937884 [Physella acuta]|uniref:uncharacterized protein LOC131937884 n=1 Tax=Physella acuta TaxID=109671 RepID=UPI0027DD62D0|nr:uncharacterized protein LOC131937884 [Physella acuta]